MEPNKIKPYIQAQIQLEEKYYDELHAILAPLIIKVNKYIASGDNVNLDSLNFIFFQFMNFGDWRFILELNRKYAILITRMAFNIINGYDSMLPAEFIKPNYTRELIEELNIKGTNLVDTIKGRYIALIPIGSRNNNYSMFTDVNTKEALINRCNNSISLFAQMAISEAVLNTLITDIKAMGATEYLANNQHDDRVRETHRKYFNGENWIKFDNPPPCGHVATEAGCRCFVEAYR